MPQKIYLTVRAAINEERPSFMLKLKDKFKHQFLLIPIKTSCKQKYDSSKIKYRNPAILLFSRPTNFFLFAYLIVLCFFSWIELDWICFLASTDCLNLCQYIKFLKTKKNPFFSHYVLCDSLWHIPIAPSIMNGIESIKNSFGLL